VKYDYAVIGACKAGLSAVETLRERVPAASILLINGEDRLPYKRTHLTKKLASGFSHDEFALKEESWYSEQAIELWNNSRVVEIDSEKNELICSDGRTASWKKLLIASGAVPFQANISGKELIKHLRSAADTEIIRNTLLNSRRVAVLGQGVEGVEIAEQCRKMGLEVYLTGRDSRLMQRWLDERLSGKLLDLLSSEGIHCSFNRDVSKITKKGELYRVHSSTEILEADIVLASTGIRGNPALTEALGIYGEKGIACDLQLKTRIPDIYAAGDAVEVPPGWPRGLWHWAEYQGRTAAINMSGGSQSIENTPTRLKCEPFGNFYFSMALQDVVEGDHSTVFFDDERGYLKIFEREGRTVAALMEGLSKTESKILEKGIHQRQPADLLASSFF
jgi:3-phenylpropionate/trans-cinnamate dioxygenase ferredoxin reductase component